METEPKAKSTQIGDQVEIHGHPHTILSVDKTSQPNNPAIIAIETPEPEVTGDIHSFGGGTVIRALE